MTSINYTEYSQLQTFDQALVWAVTTLAKANRHPDNKDYQQQASIRADAVNLVSWDIVLDEDGQPFLNYSATFPLVAPNPLASTTGLPQRIPEYVMFEPDPELMAIPATGQGMPALPIPPEIDTLERLVCWLSLIGHQLRDYIAYANALNRLQLVPDAPAFTIGPKGLDWEQPISFSELTALRLVPTLGTDGGGGGGTAGEVFSDFSDTRGPLPLNSEKLAGQVADARDRAEQSSEPPAIPISKGYDSIDTLPQCADQDPKMKAYTMDFQIHETKTGAK
jgi:hypothetical protein